MYDTQKEEIVNDLMDCTTLALDLFGAKSLAEKKLVIELLNCCEDTLTLPAKKKRSIWVKRRRSTEEPRSSESYYREDIGMSKECFLMLLNYIQDDMQRKNTIMREAITAGEKFASVLKVFVSGQTFKALNDSGEIRLSTAFLSKATPEVCRVLWNKLKSKYLKFPSTIREWKRIAEEFSQKCDFPNCLGALQTRHIYFKSLRKDGDYYHNRTGGHSLKLLALVDANCRFIFTDVGSSGQTSDADVLAQSALQEILNEADDYFPRERTIGNERIVPFVMVGSESMPLQKHIMKPYSSTSMHKRHQMFNIRHAVAKHVADHAFKMLEKQFKILQTVIKLRVETVELITLASCILHNYLLDYDENYKADIESNISMEIGDQRYEDNFNNPKVEEAEEVRQEFMAYFSEEGYLNWEME